MSILAECSGLDGRVLGREELLAQDSLTVESLCCVLEQDTLYTA